MGRGESLSLKIGGIEIRKALNNAIYLLAILIALLGMENILANYSEWVKQFILCTIPVTWLVGIVIFCSADFRIKKYAPDPARTKNRCILLGQRIVFYGLGGLVVGALLFLILMARAPLP